MTAKKNLSVLKLCTSALLLAMGILLPQIFHIIGGSATGGMFLPMHIPVFMTGLLLGPFYGGAIGAITPVLSFMLTGMPPAAKLPFMFLELISYGILSGVFSAKKLNIYVSLILAQIGGRVVYGLVLAVASGLFHLNVPAAVSVLTALISGIPGIVIQIVLIPVMILLLERVVDFDRANQKV